MSLDKLDITDMLKLRAYIRYSRFSGGSNRCVLQSNTYMIKVYYTETLNPQ